MARLFDQIPNEAIAKEILRQAREAEIVAIDTETNGQDIRDGRGQCYGVSLAFNDTALYLPFRHVNCPEENFDIRDYLLLLQAILDSCTVIYHNAQFDIPSLRTLGLEPRGKRFVDTMVCAHLIDEVRPFGGKGLDACVAYYCPGLEGKKNSGDSAYSMFLNSFKDKREGYRLLTASLTAEYAMWDAWITLQLYRALVPKLNSESLGPVWKHKAKMIERLIAMGYRGIRVDTALCEKMALIGHQEMDVLKSSLNGLNPGSTKDLHVLLIDQLHLPVVKRTPKGAPSFDKYAMEEYDFILDKVDDPTAKSVLAYRGWQKSVSSNYESYLKFLSPDGRLRTNYLLHGTKTNRLSSREPNLQQIPKIGEKPWNGKMKQCFIPEDGYTLLEGDYSQLEFRLAAGFAREQILIDEFSNPTGDVFEQMRIMLEARGWHGVTRQMCKTLTYSIMYGAGLLRIMFVFGVSEDKAREIRDNFYSVYKKIFAASKRASAHAIKYKKIPMWSGRYRHFINPQKEAHKAYNALCQGGGADIVERTMLRCADQGFDTDDCRMLLQVHDSIVWEVRTDLVAEIRPQLKACMEAVTPDFGVPFYVDVHQWGLAA